MTHSEPLALGALMQHRRHELGLSLSEVARRAGIDKGTLSLLERGKVTQPQPANLSSLAAALELPAGDLFAAADYLQSADLPSLRPYMRAKYHDLPEEALAYLERYVAELAALYGGGPTGKEDER